jgi:acyl-CoA thioesterase-1
MRSAIHKKLLSMRQVLLAALALLLLASVAQATTAARNPTVLVVGDSLSAGYGMSEQESWVALLRDRLAARGYGYEVVNASLTGDTTGSGLQRLPRTLALHHPAIVIIELGGNDGLRGTPIKVVRSNLAAMIELCRDAGAEVILAGMQIPTNYGSSYTQAFTAVYPALATQYRVELVDFFLERVALDLKLIQADGIHPTAEAQPLLLDNVWPVLEKKLRKTPKTAAR